MASGVGRQLHVRVEGALDKNIIDGFMRFLLSP